MQGLHRSHIFQYIHGNGFDKIRMSLHSQRPAKSMSASIIPVCSVAESNNPLIQESPLGGENIQRAAYCLA